MERQQLPEDFKEFIQFLNSNNVKYLLIGGWAVGLHGHPRATKDIDFLISAKDENIDGLKNALEEFNAPQIDMEDFKKDKDSFIRMGVAPIQIDIIKEADGIDFEDCYSRREIIMVENIEIPVISKADLIVNKKSTGRLADLADAEKLSGEH